MVELPCVALGVTKGLTVWPDGPAWRDMENVHKEVAVGIGRGYDQQLLKRRVVY